VRALADRRGRCGPGLRVDALSVRAKRASGEPTQPSTPRAPTPRSTRRSARCSSETPPGSVILLVAGNVTREWALFRPREGFPQPGRLLGPRRLRPCAPRALAADIGATHIVVENDQLTIPTWKAVQRTAPVMTARCGPIPPGPRSPSIAPPMRLFERAASQSEGPMMRYTKLSVLMPVYNEPAPCAGSSWRC